MFPKERESSYRVFTDPIQREYLQQRFRSMVEVARDVTAVLFADKGARPLITPFMTLWPRVFPNKPRPEIGFINIGREKVGEVDRYALTRGLDSQKAACALKDINIAVDIFGVEHIQQVREGLSRLPPGPRLFVDEIAETRVTWEVAKGIFRGVDPNNQYFLFALLDGVQHYRLLSPEDRSKQTLPWGSHNILVQDITVATGVMNQSFVTERAIMSEDNREFGLQIRRELRQLALEA